MSPPKVSLAGKEPLKLAANETATEKGDELEFPAVINVETDRRAHVMRNRLRQQRNRRIVCGVALVIIFTVAALSTLALVHRFRHRQSRKGWKCHYGKEKLPETVEVDHENKLIRAKHDHDDNAQTQAMEFLHEYDRGLVAYKDKDKNICYIDRLDETFEDGYERWEAYEKNDRDSKALKVIDQKPIEIEVVKHIGDVHIYAHCENAQSFWVMEIEEREVTTAMKVVYV